MCYSTNFVGLVPELNVYLSGDDPGSLPFPLQVGQESMIETVMSLLTPRAASRKERFSWKSWNLPYICYLLAFFFETLKVLNCFIRLE